MFLLIFSTLLCMSTSQGMTDDYNNKNITAPTVHELKTMIEESNSYELARTINNIERSSLQNKRKCLRNLDGIIIEDAKVNAKNIRIDGINNAKVMLIEKMGIQGIAGLVSLLIGSCFAYDTDSSGPLVVAFLTLGTVMSVNTLADIATFWQVLRADTASNFVSQLSKLKKIKKTFDSIDKVHEATARADNPNSHSSDSTLIDV